MTIHFYPQGAMMLWLAVNCFNVIIAIHDVFGVNFWVNSPGNFGSKNEIKVIILFVAQFVYLIMNFYNAIEHGTDGEAIPTAVRELAILLVQHPMAFQRADVIIIIGGALWVSAVLTRFISPVAAPYMTGSFL